jgi:FixJ family two-component response regulator
VIIVSSEQSVVTESTARELGAVDFLHKPVDEQKLNEAVNRVLGIQANAS